MEALCISNLVKSYNKGKTLAVDDVSFSVEKGEMFGLIGPDGSGKTSIFRMLTTLLLPDKGSASVAGHDVVKDYQVIRSIVGYMPGRFSLYQDLSVEENLNFFATLFNTTIEENYSLIKEIYVQLEPFKTRRAGKLSGGMKQKLALCCALIHKPEVLFLDEPTTGVDVMSRKEFWEMLKRLQKEGITVLVSTSYMDEATLCDRIGLIQGGKLLKVDTPANVIRDYPDKLYSVKAGAPYQLLKDLSAYPERADSYSAGAYVHLRFKAPDQQSSARLLEYLHSKGHENVEVNETEATVEDCFIRLME